MAAEVSRITSAEDALQAIEKISATGVAEKDKEALAYAVADYLKQNTFLTRVDSAVKKASKIKYYAALEALGAGRPNIVKFTYMKPPHQNSYTEITAWVVPRVSIDSLIANNNKLPSQALATIDITQAQPPFICTEKLSGCCFVIGWRKKEGIMYVGHIEPSQNHDRTFIASYVREHEIFPIPKSQLSEYICFGANDNTLPSAYNHYKVNIIGFILLTRIWMVFEFENENQHGSMGVDYKKD